MEDLLQFPLSKTREFANWFNNQSPEIQKRLGQEFHSITGGTLSKFTSPAPVAVAIIPVIIDGDTSKRYLMGIIRNIQPGLGGAAFPGGYMDKSDSGPSMSAKREFFEETGIDLNTFPSHQEDLVQINKTHINHLGLVPFFMKGDDLHLTSEQFNTYREKILQDYRKSLEPGYDGPVVETADLLLLEKGHEMAFESHQHFLDIFLANS